MEMWEEYTSPTSIKEALAILKSFRGEARIIAGGTDLVLDLKDQIRKVKCLVDISGIEELSRIEPDGESIRVGAAVTHSQVASSKLIWERAPLLAEAAFAIGSPQIRNRGTVVGNVVNAQPAADTAVALFALEAKAEITNSNGSRLVPIEKLYRGIGVSEVDSTAEIVTALYFKSLMENQGSAFVRLAQRKALALPMLNVAVVVTVQDKHFEEARIVVAPVAPMPFRARQAEAVLRGATINLDAINTAANIVMGEAQPRDSDLRGSAEYRKEMVKVLVRRALEQAVAGVRPL
jgi:carbon-monoxide dehydrogenase medium subunit